jgi:serine/threonine-protein kinase HipA
MTLPQRCPITYELLEPNQKYSLSGLQKLSRRLITLNDLPFSAPEMRQEAAQRAAKMSIQGVQSKLSAKLNVPQSEFTIVDINGRYILKPQSDLYPELPENEDLTMRLAATIGIEVPLHGMIYAKDGSLTYFIQRFDRAAKSQKLAVEDFAQLSGHTRETKYNFSMEKLAKVIEQFCTFPLIEKQKLLQRTIFNFLIGNEDMHLKNFSLISRNDKIELSPAYDLLNTTIALKNAKEEIALPLNAKKRNINYKDLIEYYGKERLNLNEIVIKKILTNVSQQYQNWQGLIKQSFLSEAMKDKYLNLLHQRFDVVFA